MTISAEVQAQASARFVFSHPAPFIAFGFGVGLAPVAPGTFGTLLALPVHAWLAPRASPQEYVLMLLAMFVVGIWACDVTGRKLGVHDHGGMVWDETTAFLLVLFLTPDDLVWQAFAFLLFRLFDILKPAPIRHYDRSVRNGFGVMLDDLIAAFYALLCLAGVKLFFD